MNIAEVAVTDVVYSNNLLRDDNIIRKITRLFRHSPLSLQIGYPPFVLKTAHGYELIGRLWSFDKVLQLSLKNFTAIVVSPEEVDEVLNFDQKEIAMLHGLRSHNVHRSTLRRRVLKEAGAVCPFCGGYIRTYRQKENEHAKGGHFVHCEKNPVCGHSKNHAISCDFKVKLTPHEFTLFRANKICMVDLMIAIDKQCSHNQPLYLRLLNWGSKREKVERCRSYFSAGSACQCKHYVLVTAEETK